MIAPRILGIGDSITANSSSWFDKLCQRYPLGATKIKRAVGGASIITDADADLDMTGQVALAINDNADRIYVAIGANDNDASNMETLRATYEANIETLRSTNPKARITCFNAWPTWYDSGGGNIVMYPKDIVRANIAIACANQGVQCVDTTNMNYGGVTYSYLLTKGSGDFVHPNDAGNDLITNWIVANGYG